MIHLRFDNRLLVWKAITLVLLGAAFFMLHAQPSLLVCIPGASNIQTVQKSFESVVGEGKILAFARIKDLEGTLVTAPEAFLIIPAPFVQYTPGYSVALKAKTGGADAEKYEIVTTAATMTKKDLAAKRVGILDFLGREKLPLFVKEYFGFDIPALKRANKTEDLLTMLGMETVDAIIVSVSGLKEIQSSTKQSLFVVAESIQPVGGPVLAFKSGKDVSDIRSKILKASSSIAKDAGIDKWEEK